MAERVLVIGQQGDARPPGLPEHASGVEYVFADDLEAVRRHLPGTRIAFHYGLKTQELRDAWDVGKDLRWIHVGGVGVDWLLFPELVASDVVVTNSHGVFDVTLPEYVLTLTLALAKGLPTTLRAQERRAWRHQFLQPVAGQRVLILGAGSIGRSAARLLGAVDMRVTLVGRSERPGGPGGDPVRAVSDLHSLLPHADWLISLVPLTGATRGLIGAAELALLPAGARVINLGRGPVIVEPALIDALSSGHLGGAALDVFESEPLQVDSPLWAMPNVIVSPHIGGDVTDTPAAISGAFLTNLHRYLTGAPLLHVVDKRLGFIPSVAG